METEERRIAKRALVQHMLHGQPWHVAAAAAGLHISHPTAYRLVQRVRTEGEEALTDRRHGHPSKVRALARQCLEAYWHEHPQASCREAQQALHTHVGVRVSQSHLSRVRATLGLARVDGGKKAGTLASTSANLARGGSWLAPAGCRSRDRIA
jgi:transposase